jgi:multidrug efflux system membrane fusion protein
MAVTCMSMDADGVVPGSGRLRRRRRILLGVVALALAAAAGGLVVSTTIKSPAELAAQTRPPGLTQLTATVRRRVITSTVLAQGVIAVPAEVSGPAASAGGGSAGGGSAGGGSAGAQPIVTHVFLHPGTDVVPGSVILEVAGRPVFAFAGTIPAYRNLVPGETGEDVAELQAALASLGFGLGDDTSGVYGPGTASAVAAFYQNIGYSAPTISTGPKADRGAMMPLSEFMFVPRFPAHVAGIGAKVGGMASGPLVTLSMGNPAIAGQLNPSDRGLVRPGMKVTITNTVTGKSVPGRVASVKNQTRTKGSISGGIYLPMRIRPKRPLATSRIGQDVTLTISAAHSSGAVLAVPEAAVFASVNGSTYVTTVTGTHSLVRVPVRTGITGDGLVEVTPVGGGTLAAGDSVLTGEDYLRPASSPGPRRSGGKQGQFSVVPPG